MHPTITKKPIFNASSHKLSIIGLTKINIMLIITPQIKKLFIFSDVLLFETLLSVSIKTMAKLEEKPIIIEIKKVIPSMCRTHLSAIERGERKPTLETLYRISCALNVNMSDIIIKIESELESAK